MTTSKNDLFDKAILKVLGSLKSKEIFHIKNSNSNILNILLDDKN